MTPQVRVGQYRIDFVVEGHNDARLAVECDGDKYHGAEKWAEDMQRQRTLERAGWVFWRCFGSAFYRKRKEVMDDLLAVLSERGIEPIGAEGAPRSVHVEHRVVSSAAPHWSRRRQTGAEGEGEQRTETSDTTGWRCERRCCRRCSRRAQRREENRRKSRNRTENRNKR